jgi:hypothetical protein
VYATPVKVKGVTSWIAIGSAVTDAAGGALFEVPVKYVGRVATPIRATFAGDASFLTSTANAIAIKN